MTIENVIEQLINWVDPYEVDDAMMEHIIPALKKQIPMPVNREDGLWCPVCGTDADETRDSYCTCCGQKLSYETPQFGCKDGVCEIDWGE